MLFGRKKKDRKKQEFIDTLNDQTDSVSDSTPDTLPTVPTVEPAEIPEPEEQGAADTEEGDLEFLDVEPGEQLGEQPGEQPGEGLEELGLPEAAEKKGKPSMVFEAQEPPEEESGFIPLESESEREPPPEEWSGEVKVHYASADFPEESPPVIQHEESLLSRILSVFRKRKKTAPEIDWTQLREAVYIPPAIPGRILAEYPVDGDFAKAYITVEGPYKKYYLIMPRLPIDPDKFEGLIFDVCTRAYNEKARMLSKGRQSEELKVTIADVFGIFLDTIRKWKLNLTQAELAALWTHYLYRVEYAGPLTPLLMDRNIEDISCSGYGLPVFVYHRLFGWLETNIVFPPDKLDDLMNILANKASKTITLKNPIVDFALPDFRARVNVVYGTEYSTKGTNFTIRKARTDPITPLAMVDTATFSLNQVAMLWTALHFRCSIMFIGETASGKTTALNATALMIPLNQKIISVEDTPEIYLPHHKHWTALVIYSKSAGEEKSREAYRLIEAMLRQRPNYVIMGEARGEEVHALLQGASIGYPFLSTMHGGSVDDLIRRLTGAPLNVAYTQITALNLLVLMKNMGSRAEPVRKCVEIGFLNTEEIGRSLCHYVKGDPLYVATVSRYNVQKEGFDDDVKEFLALLSRKANENPAIVQEEFEKRRRALERAYGEGKITLKQFLQALLDFERAEQEKAASMIPGNEEGVVHAG